MNPTKTPSEGAMARARKVRDWWADKGCVLHSDLLVARIFQEITLAERRGAARAHKRAWAHVLIGGSLTPTRLAALNKHKGGSNA